MHLIGGVPSQMKMRGWLKELSFETDQQLRDYLTFGIVNGFNIVDPGAIVEPYMRKN